MENFYKSIAQLGLITLALMAVSIICIASGEPRVMDDCGDQMNAFMCPFMIASVPTILSVIFSGILIFSLTLISIEFSDLRESDIRKNAALSKYRNDLERPPVSYLNPVLNLISRGILHSKIFSF